MAELLLILFLIGIALLVLPWVVGLGFRLLLLPVQIAFGLGAGILAMLTVMLILPLAVGLSFVMVVLPLAIIVKILGCVVG